MKPVAARKPYTKQNPFPDSYYLGVKQYAQVCFAIIAIWVLPGGYTNTSFAFPFAGSGADDRGASKYNRFIPRSLFSHSHRFKTQKPGGVKNTREKNIRNETAGGVRGGAYRQESYFFQMVSIARHTGKQKETQSHRPGFKPDENWPAEKIKSIQTRQQAEVGWYQTGQFGLPLFSFSSYTTCASFGAGFEAGMLQREVGRGFLVSRGGYWPGFDGLPSSRPAGFSLGVFYGAGQANRSSGGNFDGKIQTQNKVEVRVSRYRFPRLFPLLPGHSQQLEGQKEERAPGVDAASALSVSFWQNLRAGAFEMTTGLFYLSGGSFGARSDASPFVEVAVFTKGIFSPGAASPFWSGSLLLLKDGGGFARAQRLGKFKAGFLYVFPYLPSETLERKTNGGNDGPVNPFASRVYCEHALHFSLSEAGNGKSLDRSEADAPFSNSWDWRAFIRPVLPPGQMAPGQLAAEEIFIRGFQPAGNFRFYLSFRLLNDISLGPGRAGAASDDSGSPDWFDAGPKKTDKPNEWSGWNGLLFYGNGNGDPSSGLKPRLGLYRSFVLAGEGKAPVLWHWTLGAGLGGQNGSAAFALFGMKQTGENAGDSPAPSYAVDPLFFPTGFAGAHFTENATVSSHELTGFELLARGRGLEAAFIGWLSFSAYGDANRFARLRLFYSASF